MNTIRNNLLNSAVMGLSGIVRSPDGGAGAGIGEPAPAAPAAADTSSAAPKAGDPASGFSDTVEADEGGTMFAMPSDDALFSLEEESEHEETTPASPTQKTPAGEQAATATTPASPTPAAQGTQPQQTPAAAATTPPTGTPAATPQQPAPTEQQPTSEPSPAPQVSPHQDFLAMVDQNREALAQRLAKEVYAITDADAEALGLVDKAPLERMAANLHVNVMRAQAAMLTQTLPQAVAQIVTHLNRAEAATAAFYEANKELNRATDHAIVEKYAQLFWQANPKGTLAQFNQQVGMMAKAELNKLVPQVAQSQPAPGVQPKPVPKKQQPTFVPATPQGGAPATAKGAPQGEEIWSVLAGHMLNSDE